MIKILIQSQRIDMSLLFLFFVKGVLDARQDPWKQVEQRLTVINQHK